MQFYWFLLGSLAVWRVTHLLNAEDGPWKMLDAMRHWLGRGVLSSLFECFYCLSLWVAIIFALIIGETWKARPLLWLAFSGTAILLERITTREEQAAGTQRAVYYEEEQENVLRQK